MKKSPIGNLNTYLIIALVIVVAIGLYFTLSVPVSKKEAQAPMPPREIMLTVLGSDCEDCFNMSVAVDFIKKQESVNVTSVKEMTIADSKDMLAKYNISRLPALLITGNISNLTIPNFDQKEDALVFANTPPPYYDVASEKIVGKVTIIRLDAPSCKECFNISLIVDQLKQVGIKIVSDKTVQSTSDEGKALISKYHIDKVPTLIFNKDALEYDVIKQVWNQVGTEESDGKLVLRFLNPPYINTSTGKTEGLVELTYLVDKTCTTCYNASVLKSLFKQSFNMYFKKDDSVDVSSTKGKSLIKKYGIELVPTVILSKEAGVYPAMATAWKQVGTEEKDGMFVFRNVALLKEVIGQEGGQFAYKNLTSGDVMSDGSNTSSAEEPEIAPPSEE